MKSLYHREVPRVERGYRAATFQRRRPYDQAAGTDHFGRPLQFGQDARLLLSGLFGVGTLGGAARMVRDKKGEVPRFAADGAGIDPKVLPKSR